MHELEHGEELPPRQPVAPAPKGEDFARRRRELPALFDTTNPALWPKLMPMPRPRPRPRLWPKLSVNNVDFVVMNDASVNADS